MKQNITIFNIKPCDDMGVFANLVQWLETREINFYDNSERMEDGRYKLSIMVNDTITAYEIPVRLKPYVDVINE